MGEWQFLYNKGRILRVDNTKIWLPDIFTFMVDPLKPLLRPKMVDLARKLARMTLKMVKIPCLGAQEWI